MSRRGLPARLVHAALGVMLLGGCVYYNGMYNAKRLAGSAWKAEREGRTFDANNLWGQVITRAESLVVRHPQSKYVDEATVLKGIALSRLRQCADAVPPLTRVSAIGAKGNTGEEAALALGRCQLELGDPVAAELAFSRVLESADPIRRREARLQRGRALRQMGRAADALAALDGLNGGDASQQRLLALGAAGRQAEAIALADTLFAVDDSVRTWDSVVTIVGRANPRTASALVDHLGAKPNVSVEVRARRLYEDAERLEPIDSARATERFRQAARAGIATAHGSRAALELLRRDLRQISVPGELAGAADSLGRLAAKGGPASGEARLLQQTLVAVRSASDSSGPESLQGDLRVFLAGETARDSLLAPALAATLFRQVVETWPDSPYAPKAILAAGVLDPSWGEATRPLLEERYAASPYLALLRGEDPAGYRELEDSLQAYAFSAAGAQRRPTPGARRAPTSGAPSVDDDDAARTPQRPQPTPRRGFEP